MPTFTTAGSTTYTVTRDIDFVRVRCWGAGGGAGGDATGGADNYVGGAGGTGGYAEAIIAVSQNDVLSVLVGDVGGDGNDGDQSTSAGGGGPGDAGDGGDGWRSDADNADGAGGGGGGGQESELLADDGTRLITAGGGGGGGGGHVFFNNTNTYSGGGGGGGGDNGTAGEKTDATGVEGGQDGQAGTGATQTGGAGGDAQNEADGLPGGDGSAYFDGSASSTSSAVGGGNTGVGQVEIILAPSKPSLAVSSTTDTSATLDIGDTEDEDGVRVYYREQGTSTWIQDADLGAGVVPTTYTVSGLQQGTAYEFYVGAYNAVDETDSATVSATTDAPAPTFETLSVVDDNGDGNAGELVCTWADNGTDETSYQVLLSTDGGGSYVNDSGDLAADTTVYTTGEQRDGEQYTVKIRAVYPDTTADSGTKQATTDLPDVATEDITPIDASVEDELTVPNAAVADYGDVRYQIRVSGSGNAYGSDIVVPQGGADATFGGLLDGEKYDIRARSETEHITGTWVAVAEVTLLPEPALSVASTGTNSVTLSITDNADNEDEITVDRRREYSDGFGAWAEIASLAPDTTSYSDSNVVPGTTYEYRVTNVSEHVMSSSTITAMTTKDAPTNDTPRQSGWYVELTAADGSVRAFTSDGSPERDPSLKDLERVTVTVSKDESWQLPKWEDADARVWRDGARLPVDTLVARQQRPGDTKLVIEGPAELYESAEYEFTGDVHTAAADVLDDTSLPYTVVSPDAENRDFVTVDTEAEFQAYYQDPGGTEPVTVTPSGEIRPQQYCFPFEAEDNANLSSATVSNGETAQMSDLSGTEGVNLVPSGSEVICEFTTDRPIPGDEVRVNARIARTNFDGEQRLFIDGVLVGAFLVSTSLSEQTDWYDVTGGTTYVNNDTGEPVNDIPDLSPGTHTFTMDTVTSYPGGNEVTASGYNVVDALYLYDNRPPMPSAPDSTNANNVLEGPEVTKPLDITLLHDGFLSASGATFAGTFNDVSDAQAIALSNDYGATYLPSASGAANTSTLDVDFASPAPDIQLKVTLGAFGPDDVFPAGNSQIQALESYDIDIDARDSPPLSDDQFKGRRKDILTSLVNRGNILWAAEWDGDAQDIRIRVANVADLSGSRSLDLVDYQWDTETIGRQIESATITGGSQLVQNEPLTADEGVAVSLANDRLVTGREQVRATNGGTIYTRGSDYEVDYLNGTVTDLARGNISDGEALDVTYEFKPNASYSVGGADSRNELIQTFVGASSDAVCQSIAYYLVQELKDPVVGGTATVDKDSLPAGFSWLDLFAADPLPTDITDDFYVENGTVTQSEIRANLQSRKPTGDIISIVSESLGSVEDRV